MDLGEQAHRVKFRICDRGSIFTAAFDAVLAATGIRTVLCNVRTSRLNAVAVTDGECAMSEPHRTASSGAVPRPGWRSASRLVA
jgi:hypothetical protein